MEKDQMDVRAVGKKKTQTRLPKDRTPYTK
jgi:hypothetical protein